MRAGRLVNMLLILQRRGRVTAAALSSELDVSIRTVLRDVQALHEAGVPIYTRQGALGGIELVAGFRTLLTGLAAEEAAVALLIGQPALAEVLGLAQPTATARRKILAALPRQARPRADELDNWFLVDPFGWEVATPPMLDRLASAIRRMLVAQLTIDGALLEVRPLGLVTKAGGWYLVHLQLSGPTAVHLHRLSGVRVTSTTFERPLDFDLPTIWAVVLGSGGPPSTVSGST